MCSLVYINFVDIRWILFSLRWHFFHALVDSFQGCYKDGTEPGTVDCRWLAQLGLFIRLTLFVIYALILTTMFFIYAILYCVHAIVDVFSQFTPFQEEYTYLSTNWFRIHYVYKASSSTFLYILGINNGNMEQHVYLQVIYLCFLHLPLCSMFCTLCFTGCALRGDVVESYWRYVGTS